MNRAVLPCNRQSLQAFVENSCSNEEQRTLEYHLDDCPKCRAMLDDLVASPQAWQDTRLYLSGSAFEEEWTTVGDVERYRKLLGPTDDPRMLGRVGGYEIVGILGAGGMGVVFKGFDLSLNRYVAIKMLSPLLSGSGVAKQRFLREAQSAAAVIHDNVVPIHSTDLWQGSPYLVMTYVRGESLRNRLGRRGSLSVREVLRVGMQIASGLAAAHSQGLIHRDIKPANILLETDVDRLKISDFGLARAVDDIRLTKSDMLLGTPQYMSPEQARDDALDYRTDLFSLGSVLYEACTGRPPFHASTSYGVLRRIVEGRAPAIRSINPDVPEWLERLINKLMENDREARFASAAEVESVLRQCLAHVEQPLLASLPAVLSAPEPVRRRFSFQKGKLFMSLTTLGVVVLVASLLYERPGENGGERQTKSQAAGVAPDAADAAADERPATTAGNYRVEVVGVGDVSGMTMSTTFDLSRMKMNQQTQTFGNLANGIGAEATTGGAGGGFGATFQKPNLGIALKITPLKQGDDKIVKVGSKAQATVERGRVVEFKDLGPAVHQFRQFEKQFPNAGFLYLVQPSPAVDKFDELQGELLVVPGRRSSATFDGTQKQTKTVAKEAFKLENVVTSDDGLEVTVTFPPTKSVRDARNPQERFQAMVANRGSYSATIEDDAGDLHEFTRATGGTGAAISSFTSNGSITQGSVKSSDVSTQSFGFKLLPAGRTIKAIHVTFENRTGEAEHVPFTLKGVRLQ